MITAALVLVGLTGLQVSLQTCNPGELAVTGGGVVMEGNEVLFSLCLDQDTAWLSCVNTLHRLQCL